METNEKKDLKSTYSILQGPQGELLMIIEAREGEPDCPRCRVPHCIVVIDTPR